MNKKGFTLVELLAVIVVLGIIGTIATIGINKMSNKSKESINEASKKEIIVSAETFGNDNKNDFTNYCYIDGEEYSSCLTTTVGELLEKGYLKSNEECDESTCIKDYATGESLNDNKIILYTKDDQVYASYDEEEIYVTKLKIAKSSVKKLSSNFINNYNTVNDNDDNLNNDSGIYEVRDEDGTSLVYRGKINNNWVKFGKYPNNIQKFCCGTTTNHVYLKNQSSCNDINDCRCTNEINSGDDMYWRIVRVTGSGEIRMIYAGNTAPTSETQYLNLNGNLLNQITFGGEFKIEYSGYQYTLGEAHGKSTDSYIKTYIDNWYNDNLSNYDKYISTSEYCYDRTTYSGTIEGKTYTGNGIDSTQTWYMATKRLLFSKSMNLDCPNKNDIYKLKIGLLTLDEAIFAGMTYPIYNGAPAETDNYLVSEYSYWLGTPHSYNVHPYMWIIYSRNKIAKLDATGITSLNIFIRPVISLSPSVTVEGSGTYNDPYTIS